MHCPPRPTRRTRVDEVGHVIDEAIVQLADEDEVLPTKWVLVAEYLTEDGQVWSVAASSANSTVWDRMGLLDFALATEKAKVES